MAVFDLMLSICIRHTQQVLLQQLRTAEHGAVVREGRHHPDGWRKPQWETDPLNPETYLSLLYVKKKASQRTNLKINTSYNLKNAEKVS